MYGTRGSDVLHGAAIFVAGVHGGGCFVAVPEKARYIKFSYMLQLTSSDLLRYFFPRISVIKDVINMLQFN